MVAAGAQQENTMAPAGREMAADEWFRNEVQAAAIDARDMQFRNINWGERLLAEIALRELASGVPPDQVAEDTRRRRERLRRIQDNCNTAVPLATAMGALACTGYLPAGPVFCGAAAGIAARHLCTAAERSTGLVSRPTRDILTAFKRTEGADSVWEEGGFGEATNVYLDDRVRSVLEEHPRLRDVFSDFGIDLNEAMRDGLADQEVLQRLSMAARERSEEILSGLGDQISLSDIRVSGSDAHDAQDEAGAEGQDEAGAEGADPPES